MIITHWGPNSGKCGYRHRSEKVAEKCLARFRKVNRDSDRRTFYGARTVDFILQTGRPPRHGEAPDS